jgi:hypothetical protein
MKISLSIELVPFGDRADLFINGRHYILSPDTLKVPEDLNTMLAGEPEYVRIAVVGLLYEAAA